MIGQNLTAEQLVQIQLECYNNRDIDGFIKCFREDVRVFNFSDNKQLIDGKEAYREFFTEIFEQSPNLHSTLLNRIVFGTIVIDHEKIVGRAGTNGDVEMVVIYETDGDTIFKVTAMRK